jgi:SWI/SNF related-matrix-associated actin-dependent regulator of chromatin subfamily C
LEIGRNAYEANGKEVASTAVKPAEKQTNGDAAVANGSVDTSLKSLEDNVTAPEEKISCFTCGIDCTRVYYHNAKPPKDATGPAAKTKYNVCPNCFIELRLPANQDSSLYVKMETPAYSKLPDRDAPWADEEILLLLEGLEKFDDSWADIADHVGTRTREECAVKFLQLEIEDKYLDAEPAVNSTTGMGLFGSAGGHVPFAQADNPVMSVIGFLASLTQPSVTAAASGRSVDEMKRALRNQLEKTTGEEAASEKGKEKAGDSMDIDIRQETTTTTTTTTTTSALATIPLAATAARGAALASHEEREMTRLVSAAVNTTLQKFELKLAQFNEMESILQAERRELERGRQQLFLDRLAFKKRVKDVQEGLRMAASTGGDEGIKMAQDVMEGTDKLTFQGALPTVGSVQPLSAEGQIKSFDI